MAIYYKINFSICMDLKGGYCEIPHLEPRKPCCT